MVRCWKSGRGVFAGVVALGLVACAPQEPPAPVSQGHTHRVIPRGLEEVQIGAEQHPRILDEFGGIYPDPRLAAYVDAIGRRIVASTEQPDEDWTFTILDTPIINAFAVPGGYVYVTRGLIALADDEAELAAVIGHEIGHITAQHGAERAAAEQEASAGVIGAVLLGAVLGGPLGAIAGSELGAVVGAGRVAGYSREQEYEADDAGVRYLAHAGYDPVAQADFLVSMAAHYNLRAEIEGDSGRRGDAHFLSSHPSSANREARARKTASLMPLQNPDRGQVRFFEAIDGLAYGDDTSNGIVSEGRFIHLTRGYRLTIPQGWDTDITGRGLMMAGPGAAILRLERIPSGGTDAKAYLSDGFLAEYFQRFGSGIPPRVEHIRINGLQAAKARFRGNFNGKTGDVQITAIPYGGEIIRILSIVPPEDEALAAQVQTIVSSFGPARVAELDGVQAERIVIYKVRPGDTISSIAARMVAGPRAADRLRVLNSLPPGYQPLAGDQLKLVVQ